MRKLHLPHTCPKDLEHVDLRIGSLKKLAKWQFVYIVGWDLSPTFMVVYLDNMLDLGLRVYACYALTGKSNTPIVFAPTTANLQGLSKP